MPSRPVPPIEAPAGSRAYHREWARRKGQAAWEEEALGRTTCPRRLSWKRTCRTPLQSRFVDGETIPWCPTCDRWMRGVCIECGAVPVVGQVRKALRCAHCSRVARHAREAAYRARHAKIRRVADRKRRAREGPEERRVKARRWRHARPEKVAARAKRDYRAHRAERLVAQQRYYERHRAAIVEKMRLRRRGLLPPRPCERCGVSLEGRAKKWCPTCKQAVRKEARAEILARMERKVA